MPRFVLEVMYDGTRFHGSQIQGDTATVQLYVNQTLTTLLRIPTDTFGASRTDEGVHALCNFYHFDIAEDTELRPDFMYKCNAILPHGIAIKAIYIAPDPEFNARFEAISRRYRYRIYNGKDPFLVNRAYFYPFKLNRELLNQAAAIIPEYTHFESFAKRNTQSKTFTCHITQSKWKTSGNELHYVVEGNRFLRGMVRGLVGTQLQVARGKITIAGFRKIIEGNDCTKAYFNVEGHGLYLEEITYPEGRIIKVQ